MRWHYPDSNDAAERQLRDEILGRIDRWWGRFSEMSSEIGQVFKSQSAMDLAGWMQEQLALIVPELMWEFGPALTSPGHRLVITPETSRHLRPLVDVLIERAPKLEAWEFYGYRPPETFRDLEPNIKARLGEQAAQLLGGLVCQPAANEINQIDLVYYSNNFSVPGEKVGTHVAFLATELLLGEQLLDEWIGQISTAKPPMLSSFRKGYNPVPLEQLRATVQALIEGTREELPGELRLARFSRKDVADKISYQLFNLKPPAAAEYAGRGDLITLVTSEGKLVRAAASGAHFSSGRFSRLGEKFCYLKIDGRRGPDPELFEDRAAIEDALQSALLADGTGCVFGGGTGRIYSYVDLALTDVVRGSEAIRKVLRAGKISKRSWLLFFDSSLANEWIGIYDKTEVPPGMSQVEQGG
jgi:hypothetical protein